MSSRWELDDGITSIKSAWQREHTARVNLEKMLENSETENAKLLELVRDYENCTMHADCARCEYDGKLNTHCPLSPCFPDIDELRELGVEEDDVLRTE